MAYNISIHEAFADLDFLSQLTVLPIPHFNPRGLRRPRPSGGVNSSRSYWNFNPRGLRRPRQWPPSNLFLTVVFQSTRPSQTSTQASGREGIIRRFQSTRPSQTSTIINKRFSQFRKFQSTRPSQTSTAKMLNKKHIISAHLHKYHFISLHSPKSFIK